MHASRFSHFKCIMQTCSWFLNKLASYAISIPLSQASYFAIFPIDPRLGLLDIAAVRQNLDISWSLPASIFEYHHSDHLQLCLPVEHLFFCCSCTSRPTLFSTLLTEARNKSATSIADRSLRLAQTGKENVGRCGKVPLQSTWNKH